MISLSKRNRVRTSVHPDIKQLAIAVLFVVCTSAVPSDLSADWSVETRVDSMTDESTEIAVITNSEDFSLKVYRRADATVWATFRLPEDSIEVLDERRPIFRVDKNEPHDLDQARRLGLMEELYQTEPKWISWQVFHGEGRPPSSNALVEFMEGDSVVFRYYLFTGGYKETSFSLVGSTRAINSALDL